MQILLILCIVSACVLSVPALKCYHCGRNVDDLKDNTTEEHHKECSGSSSPTQDCSEIVPNGIPSCAWVEDAHMESRGCASRAYCDQMERMKNPSNHSFQAKCCYTDLCNSDSFRSAAGKEKDNSYATRITVNGKLVILLLVLPMISAMCTGH